METERNSYARKHPWLIAIGILASLAVTAVIVVAVLFWIAFRNFTF